MSETVVNTTETGYKKVEDSQGIKYRSPDGTYTSQQAYAGSKQQERNEPIRDADTGTIIDNKPERDVIEVTGELQEVKDGYRLSADTPNDMGQIRAILNGNPAKWEAYQIRITAVVQCKEGTDKFTVSGFSRVKSSMGQVEIEVPKRELDSEGRIVDVTFETELVDILTQAKVEAEQHGWSKIDCSVILFNVKDINLITYVGPQSEWKNQAEKQSHIEI